MKQGCPRWGHLKGKSLEEWLIPFRNDIKRFLGRANSDRTFKLICSRFKNIFKQNRFSGFVVMPTLSKWFTSSMICLCHIWPFLFNCHLYILVSQKKCLSLLKSRSYRVRELNQGYLVAKASWQTAAPSWLAVLLWHGLWMVTDNYSFNFLSL